MIDLDRMEAQLAAALTEDLAPLPTTVRHAPVPAPTPAPAPRSARRRPATAPVVRPAAIPVTTATVARPVAPPTGGVPELLELGLLDEVDARIDQTSDRRDYVTWSTMRAILSGRQDVARAGIRDLISLAQSGNDAEALERAWLQRFWVAFEWGSAEERLDVLDHCRERAYRFDDLRWSGNLVLLLAAMGKNDEAARAFDIVHQAVAAGGGGPARLDVVTNLVEGAAVFGDAGRVAAAGRYLRAPAGRMVVVGAGAVCKGSVDRYVGLTRTAHGQWGDAAECFRSAEAAHRAIGAGPLLARTRQQASGALVAA